MINMARETKAQKASRMTFLLGEYDRVNRELRKLSKEAEEMKAKIADEESGTYGDWILSRGTPREILDQSAARDALTKAGVPIPTKTTSAPLVITSTVANR